MLYKKTAQLCRKSLEQHGYKPNQNPTVVADRLDQRLTLCRVLLILSSCRESLSVTPYIVMEQYLARQNIVGTVSAFEAYWVTRLRESTCKYGWKCVRLRSLVVLKFTRDPGEDLSLPSHTSLSWCCYRATPMYYE